MTTRTPARQHRPHTHAVNRHDPTQTTTLRRQYGRQLAKRYRYLKGLLWQGVAVDDRLALRDREAGRQPGGNATGTQNDDNDDENGGRRDRDEGGPDRPTPSDVPPTDDVPEDILRKPYLFPEDEEKIMLFTNWVGQAQDDLIADAREKPSDHWGEEYIAYSYEQGLENARTHLEERGVDISEAALKDTFNLPIHKNTLQGLHVRNFKALDAITQAVGRQISDVLTEAFLEGVNPRVAARRMNDRIDSVGIVRSRMVARTEIIRAHNEASLSRYERVMGSDAPVAIVAEFSTAGDSRVWEICRELEGKRFSIKEARNLIPGQTHPNCRCSWVPVTKNV
jgi:SPP1 gp7 family putative phage head morphogenesis protein